MFDIKDLEKDFPYQRKCYAIFDFTYDRERGLNISIVIENYPGAFISSLWCNTSNIVEAEESARRLNEDELHLSKEEVNEIFMSSVRATLQMQLNEDCGLN